MYLDRFKKKLKTFEIDGPYNVGSHAWNRRDICLEKIKKGKLKNLK